MKPRTTSMPLIFLYAIIGAVPVALVIIIFITIIGGMDDYYATLQSDGLWWVILPFAYVITVIYYFYEPIYTANKENGRVLDSLMLYLKAKLKEDGLEQPTSKDEELLREHLLRKLKIWSCSDEKIWKRYYPEEKLPKNIFGLVDDIPSEIKKLSNFK